jgi:Uma2 family endonuclease
MGAVATQLTLEQFQQLPDRPGRQELNAGELIEMAPPFYSHSRVLRAIFLHLHEAAKPQRRFVVYSETAYLLVRDPATVRVPDVSLVAAERLQNVDQDSYIEGAPEVAIEVVSPSETAVGLNEKIRQFLAAGAKVVIAAYPKTRELHIYRPGVSTLLLGGADRLEIPEALPGWSVLVDDLFPASVA